MSAPRTAELTLADKHDRLREIIAGYGSALVCFSGGVDSTLLLRVAHDVLGDRCVGLTAVSITMAASERTAARELAAGIGARLEVVESHELERPGFAQNPTDRCYHCKAELLEIARPRADALAPRRGADRNEPRRPRRSPPGPAPPPTSAARATRWSTPASRSRTSARCPAAWACRPGTSRSSPACRRASPTAPRSPPSGCGRSTGSRTRCAPSASASCACATTATWRAWRSKPPT